MSVPVDAVVMWVDSSDPYFQESYNKFSPQGKEMGKHGEGKGRHRDNGELRYCLRGINENLPWVRNIFLVTNGQKPGFIKEEAWGDKIHLVKHSDILPDNVLPTFNTFAIESALQNIEGLSDVFIRFSDDFLVIKRLEQEAVLGKQGFGNIFLGPHVPLPEDEGFDLHKKAYLNLLAHNRQILESRLEIKCDKNFLHAPQVRHRSICKEMYSCFKEYIDFTRCSKFRSPKNFSLLYSYPFFLLSKEFHSFYNDGEFYHDDVKYKHWSVCRQVLAGQKNVDWKEKLKKAFDGEVCYLNVNDNFGNEPDVADVNWLKGFLEKEMHYKASWER